ncbi:hypothetical protein ES705_05159 [subsurface metagenome]
MKDTQRIQTKHFQLTLLITAVVILGSCGSKQKQVSDDSESSLKKGVVLVDYREKHKVDIFIDGDLFTSYIYPTDLEKPVLFPIRDATGTIITRGFPLDPREGERVDHPHHVGLWFNFGDVNGYDFWNNSKAIPEEKKGHYGRVLHRGVKRAESRDDGGVLEIAADWQVPGEEDRWHTVLQEQTIFEFSGDEDTRSIDRITRLTAQEDQVVFTDNKEGLFAVRLDRAFEYPSDKPQIYTDTDGNPTAVKVMDNKGKNGHYRNSEGVEGTEVWGKRAVWTSLSSNVGDEDITIAIFDHPDNPQHPSFWHARGYGLFAVNNLGAVVFDENNEPFRLELAPGESIVFKHRVYITSWYHASDEQLNTQFADFSRK